VGTGGRKARPTSMRFWNTSLPESQIWQACDTILGSMQPLCRSLVVLLPFAISVYAAAQKFDVKIIDRQNSATGYTYYIPAFSDSTSNTDVNCNANPNNVNCSGTTRTRGTSTPARTISYQVFGATLSLQLPDGRIAVVNCESKHKMKGGAVAVAEALGGRDVNQGDHVNRRSCRIPPVNGIQAEFDRDKAKLMWPVSLDGKKLESETYKILAVLDKP
jgi:hypothetical protein